MLPVTTQPAADGMPVRFAPQAHGLQSLGCADPLFDRLVPCQPFGPLSPVLATPAETTGGAGLSSGAAPTPSCSTPGCILELVSTPPARAGWAPPMAALPLLLGCLAAIGAIGLRRPGPVRPVTARKLLAARVVWGAPPLRARSSRRRR